MPRSRQHPSGRRYDRDHLEFEPDLPGALLMRRTAVAASVLALCAALAAAGCSSSSSNSSSKKSGGTFTAILSHIDPKAPINPYNATTNSFRGYNAITLGWAKN